MLVFEPGWDSGVNNNTPNGLGKDDLEKTLILAIDRLNNRTTDKEFKYLVSHAQSDSPMAKAKVVKGMHQDTGNLIIPETHCTIEIADWPNPKRFHVWFLWIGKGGKAGWKASKVSYEISSKNYKDVDIL